MSIRKNPNRKNQYECRWLEGGKHFSRSFATEKAAKVFDAERLSSLNSGRGLRTADEKVTFDDYAQKYFSQRKKASTSLRNHGIYVRHIEPVFGKLRIRAIRHSDIQMLVNAWDDMDLSSRTISRHVAVLSGIFALAERDEVIHRVPTKGLKIPPASEPHRYAMTPTETVMLVNNVHLNYRAFVYVMVETGIRIGEAIALTIGDFDWATGKISISDSKTKSGIRKVPVTAYAQELISAHILTTGRSMANSDEPLFVSHKADVDGRVIGTRINYSNFRSRVFKPAASAIGLPELQLHDLRRTSATMLASQGASQKVVKDRMGHADIRTTLNLYVQATEEAHKVVVAILDSNLAALFEEQIELQEEA